VIEENFFHVSGKFLQIRSHGDTTEDVLVIEMLVDQRHGAHPGHGGLEHFPTAVLFEVDALEGQEAVDHLKVVFHPVVHFSE